MAEEVKAASMDEIRSIRRFINTLANHTEATPEQLGEVHAVIQKARAAGIPWFQILLKLMPFIISIFTGGGVDIAAIIAAILALLNPPTP